MYANKPCTVKMQLKWDDDDKCNILSPIHETQKLNGLPVLSLNVPTPHIKTVANCKSYVWLFSILNQIWGKLFEALFKRGYPFCTSWKTRKSTSCFTGKFLSTLVWGWTFGILQIKMCKESYKNYTSMVLHHQLENCKSRLINAYFKASQKSYVHCIWLLRCHREVSFWVCNDPALHPVVKWKLQKIQWFFFFNKLSHIGCVLYAPTYFILCCSAYFIYTLK